MRTCNGLNLKDIYVDNPELSGRINLSWLIMAFKNLGNNPKFFNAYFDKLAGNTILRQQIINGVPEEEIRKSWAEKTRQFKEIRKKYLLYPD
jgi:hypothetical protein